MRHIFLAGIHGLFSALTFVLLTTSNIEYCWINYTAAAVKELYSLTMAKTNVVVIG